MMVLYIDFELSLNMMVLYIHFELSLNMITFLTEFKYDGVVHHSDHIFELSLNMMVLYIDFELSLNMIYIHFEFKYDSVIHHSNHIFELSLNILLSHLLMLDIILTSCESVDSNTLLCNLAVLYPPPRSLSSPSQTLFSILLRLCSDCARTVLGLC